MARASVARSPALMPAASAEDLTVRTAISLAALVAEPDREPAIGFLFRRGGAREREELLARFDAAGNAAGMLALRVARGEVGIVLVDDVDAIDAVGEGVHQRIFDVLGMARRDRLHDGVAALERMEREAGDVLQPAAGAHVALAVPYKVRALGIDRVAVAQAVELQADLLAQHRLRVGEDRVFGVDAAGQREAANHSQCCRREEAIHSVAPLPWPSRLFSVLSSFSAASAITVPGGKIASAPAFIRVS